MKLFVIECNPIDLPNKFEELKKEQSTFDKLNSTQFTKKSLDWSKTKITHDNNIHYISVPIHIWEIEDDDDWLGC